MKEILVALFAGSLSIGALIIIKWLDLPAVPTAVLIIITVFTAIFALAGGFTTNWKKRKKDFEDKPVAKMGSVKEQIAK